MMDSQAPDNLTHVSTNTIHLVLLGSERLLLDALSQALNLEHDLHVVYAGSDSREAVRTCLETNPEIALIVDDLEGQNPFEIAGHVAARQKTTRVLFLTSCVSDVTAQQAIRAQAFGLLLKRVSLEVLVDSVRRVNRGEYCFSPEFEQCVVYNRENHSYGLRRATSLSSLTNRQLEVMRHIAMGQSVKEVARQLHLAPKSVESHKYRIMAKLGTKDRVELARLAIREGLIEA